MRKITEIRGPQRLLPALLVIVLVAVYTETAATFIEAWRGRDDYSHGFIVPFVSVWMAWTQRSRLNATAVRPDYVGGFLLLLLGAGMLVAGKVGSFVAGEQASVLLVAPGLVLLLFGRPVFREVLLPLAYLVLMVPPVLDPLIAWLHWPLQLLGATCASSFIRFVGIPVVREGPFLALPNATLEVADACSGVRYLISIAALSVPLAYLSLRRTSQRVLLVFAALLIGVIANPVRIALVGVWVYYRGASQVHGPGHILQGFFVSLMGFAFLFLAALVIRSLGDDKRTVPVSPIPAIGSAAPRRTERRPVTPWVLAVLFMSMIAGIVHSFRPWPIDLSASLSEIPLFFGEWKGEGVPIPRSPLRLGSADSELERIYRLPNGAETRLYVGYMRTQTQERKLTSYIFRSIYDSAISETLGGEGHNPFNVNISIVPRKGGREVICFWYYVDGKRVASPLWARVVTALRGITRRHTNGAIIAVSRQVTGDKDLPLALEELRAFSLAAYPLLAGIFRDDSQIRGKR